MSAHPESREPEESGNPDGTPADGAVPVGPLVADEHIPPWLRTLTSDVAAVSAAVLARGGDRARWTTMFGGDRRLAAVLVLFAGGWDPNPANQGGLPDDVDVLLTERASTLRQHSGQVAFPGGGADPGEAFPIDTALREAEEETGLAVDGVHVVANLPSFPVPPSGFDVTPVIAHWREPSEVRVVDEAETARVSRIGMHELLAPENRFQVRRSILGGRIYQGPAFMVDGMLVWGFTGGLIDAIAKVAGWEVPWDHHDVRPLDKMIEEAGNRQQSGFAAVHPESLVRRMTRRNGSSSDSDAARGGGR